MKRIFNVFSIVLIGLFAFVACSPQASFSDELVSVSLVGSQGKTRSLVAENDFDISSVSVWKYTAEKADSGLKSGETGTGKTNAVALADGNTGALSQGSWNFELFGYNADGALICSGSADNQTITVEHHTVKITVKPSQTETGKIVVDSAINIVDKNGTVYSGDVYTMDYTVKNSSSEDVTETVKAGTAVKSGQYKVTVVFTATSNGETYTAASASKFINVYDNLTTTVSGTITETEQAAAITAEGGMISATSESFEVAVENGTNKAEVSIPVASTPVGTTDSAKKTTVTFPAGALNLSSSDTSADVSLKVESTSIESAATSYSVETSEGAAVASFNFELVGAENAEFNGDKGVEITTYIAKGLGDDAVSIKYVGTSTGKAPELVSYTSETGELKFKVFHFSTYLVVSPNVVATDENGTIYESISAALASSAKEVTLLKDANLTEAVTLSSNRTVNLNSRTVTITGEIADAFNLDAADSLYTVAFKNGTISGKTTNNIFTLNTNASLILDAIEMNVECKRGVQFYQGSNPASLEVRNGSSITVKNGYYAVATNAKNAETTYVSIKIDDSILKTTSDESYAYHNDTTALLCNVPATLEISNSSLIGERQGAIIRGADTVHSKKISNTTVEATTTKADYTDTYESENWVDGNGVPLAALVIGDNSTSYPFGTTVELDDVTLKISEDATQHKGIYVYQDGDDYPVVVTGFINGIGTVNSDTNGAAFSLVAKIGDKYYQTLDDAVEKATEGSTISLLTDLDLTEFAAGADHAFTFANNVTLDLCGNTITSNNLGVVYEGNGLTIKNGKFVCANGGSYSLFIGDGDYSEDEEGNAIMWSATVDNIECTGGINVFTHNLTVKSTVCTEVSGTQYYALWADDDAQIIVEGGTFISPSTKAGKVLNTAPTGKIVIKGGNFTSDGSAIIFAPDNANFEVFGGTFSDNPASYLADGYTATEADGTWTVSEN